MSDFFCWKWQTSPAQDFKAHIRSFSDESSPCKLMLTLSPRGKVLDFVLLKQLIFQDLSVFYLSCALSHDTRSSPGLPVPLLNPLVHMIFCFCSRVSGWLDLHNTKRREPASDSHSFCWKFILIICSCGAEMGRIFVYWSVHTLLCESLSLCACVCVFMCCLNISWCFVGISRELGLSPMQYPEANALLVLNKHKYTHTVVVLPTAMTLHFTWSCICHWWPKHRIWLRDASIKLKSGKLHSGAAHVIRQNLKWFIMNTHL